MGVKRRVTAGLTTTHIPWRVRLTYLLAHAKMRNVDVHPAWEKIPGRGWVDEDHISRQIDKLEQALRKEGMTFNPPTD